MILDNTGLNDQDRGRGTSAKADLNEVVYTLKLGAPFDRHRAGHLRLIRKRQRFAGLPRELHIHLGADTYTPPVVHEDTDEQQPSFRPTILMERTSLAIEGTPGLSKRGVRLAVSGKNDVVDLALEFLIAEGYVEARTDGQASRHQSLKPYREAADNNDRAPVPPPCPNRAPGTVATDRAPVPLSKGTGHGARSTETSNGDHRAPTEDPDYYDDLHARLTAHLGEHQPPDG
jgi:hypothetical protein